MSLSKKENFMLKMIEQNIPINIIKQFIGNSDEVFGLNQEMYDKF